MFELSFIITGIVVALIAFLILKFIFKMVFSTIKLILFFAAIILLVYILYMFI